MLKLASGKDILSAIGSIHTPEQAQAVFENKLDAENQKKLSRITNEEALLKIANAVAMCNPDQVFISTGSAEDMAAIRAMSLEQGEEQPLVMKDHTIHFDLPEEQARIIDRTFYIVNPDEDISILAKKMMRDEAHAYLQEHMVNIMEGKTMFVGFFSRGPVGAAAAMPAIQISSSTYVMHSGNILYRNAYAEFDAEVERAGRFFINIHSQGLNRPEDLPNARVFMDRSWLTTYSTFCTYAGNTLLLKKGNHRFSVDLATYYGVEEQLSEHMFITGIRGANGRTTYFAGAAPSGCGKTTTAMVGDDFIGDDLAQMWIADDGTVRAVNPEKGIFGIVRDVNWEGDPMLMKCLREEHAEVIWSNVLVKDGVPYWEGSGEETPKDGVNFQGEWWEGKTDANGKPIPISHPNARATVPGNAIANYNEADAGDPAGVPIKVITYSGRDSDTMPPVWVAKNADEGVVIGASIVSAATATEIGATGVRRQPWANAPFIPGALGDYMSAQFAFFNSDKLSGGGRPLMAGLNYFLTHAARGGEGNGLLGEKKDVKVWLGWLEKRVNGEVEAIETPIGFLPRYEDLKELFAGIDKAYSEELYEKQFSLYLDKLIGRIDLQQEAYSKGERIPAKLFEIYAKQREELVALKEQHGSIVTPAQLAG
jgi:phosphoenolpyruvate carboxykinase (GTP)